MAERGDGARNAAVQNARPDVLDIVVVDDDARYRELAAEPFRKRGASVRATADGLEALAMCLKQVPDIILSDVQMPRLDGWQLLRLIRARPALACVPVIFLTSLDSEAERLRGYRLGVDGYIPKPYTPEELLVRVHQILRRVGQAAARGVQQTPLRGDLEHVALGSLLSFLEVEKKSGILLVVGAQVARLFVADGRLLRAEIESSTHDQNSTEVLEQALTWASGQFEFLPQAVPEASDFGDDSITSLLIEHARKSDEFKQGR